MKGDSLTAANPDWGHQAHRPCFGHEVFAIVGEAGGEYDGNDGCVHVRLVHVARSKTRSK